MFDEPFRKRFSAVADPAARWLVRREVTANQITVASFIGGVGAASLIAAGWPRAGVALWMVSRVGDGLDGAVARAGGTKSAFGGFLDITLDMAAYAAMVIGFAVLHPQLALVWTTVLAGYVLVITTTLALSDAASTVHRQVSATNRTFQFTPGLTEAGETHVAYAVWALFPEHLPWLVWVWAGALAVTTGQRIHLAWRVLDRDG